MPRYIGASVRRLDDGRLVSGRGRYVDDLRFPGLAHAAFVRSDRAHAEIVAVDLASSRATPGTMAAFTATDLPGLADVPAVPFLPGVEMPPMPALARDRVRFVGEPLAVIVAEDRYAAEDAARAAQVSYRDLPILSSVDAALASGAPKLHESLPDNAGYRLTRRGGDSDAAFAQAARVVKARVKHSRIAAVPMETRGIVAVPSGADELTIYASHQGPHELRATLAALLGWSEHRIRVVIPDVGGGFGVKASTHREDLVVARLAIELGRPVKWSSTRLEDFLLTNHARDQDDRIEAAFDADGRCLGIKTETISNLGAYVLGRGSRPPLRVPGFATGAYAIPAQHSEVTTAYTNTGSNGPYRGAGRPEAAFLIERLMGTAARELRIDPAELRRRNYIKPDQFPYTTPTGSGYDSGEYERLLDKGLATAGYREWLAERDRRRAAGEIVGVGLVTFIENTAAGWESGTVRVEPDGSVTALTGSVQMGQGVTTVHAQIVADRLGVPYERVRVIMGDTAVVPTGVGSFGSRSTAVGGSALALAADRVIERAREIAARQLEVPEEDLEYVDGAARVKGAPERAMDLTAVARLAYPALGAPVPFEPGLVASASFGAEGESIAAGAYLAFVSIDPETGRVRVERLVCVDDSGVVVNPMLAAGQVTGAVAQGIGEALLERVVYDEGGQLVTSSLLDYAIPNAASVPNPTLAHTTTPSTRNPLGIKGGGEAGMLGTPPAIADAVADALSPFGAPELHPPFTDEKVWRAIHGR
ncbi:MAG: xanthine dehydrogenase family protein molybdopterin-binding subunit [Chloroflexota bacterium]